jgi:hypothetical protein
MGVRSGWTLRLTITTTGVAMASMTTVPSMAKQMQDHTQE